jgi:hypothetical protein
MNTLTIITRINVMKNMRRIMPKLKHDTKPEVKESPKVMPKDDFKLPPPAREVCKQLFVGDDKKDDKDKSAPTFGR